jgi:hypothetical protein
MLAFDIASKIVTGPPLSYVPDIVPKTGVGVAGIAAVDG